VGLLVQVVPRDRLLPVGQPQLDQTRAQVLVGCAVERELIRRRTALAGEQLVDRARVADLVLRNRRKRDVLFEERRDSGPFGVAPAEDQLVVSYLEQRARFRLVHVPSSTSLSASSRPRGGSSGSARRRSLRPRRSPRAGRPRAPQTRRGVRTARGRRPP